MAPRLEIVPGPVIDSAELGDDFTSLIQRSGGGCAGGRQAQIRQSSADAFHCGVDFAIQNSTPWPAATYASCAARTSARASLASRAREIEGAQSAARCDLLF